MEHGHIWILWILIGIAIGWLADRLGRTSDKSTLANILVALTGALVAGFLTTHFGFGGKSGVGQAMSVILATFGAVALTFLASALTRAANRAGHPPA